MKRPTQSKHSSGTNVLATFPASIVTLCAGLLVALVWLLLTRSPENSGEEGLFWSLAAAGTVGGAVYFYRKVKTTNKKTDYPSGKKSIMWSLVVAAALAPSALALIFGEFEFAQLLLVIWPFFGGVGFLLGGICLPALLLVAWAMVRAGVAFLQMAVSKSETFSTRVSGVAYGLALFGALAFLTGGIVGTFTYESPRSRDFAPLISSTVNSDIDVNNPTLLSITRFLFKYGFLVMLLAPIATISLVVMSKYGEVSDASKKYVSKSKQRLKKK